MKEKIYTIPLTDCFKEKSPCPFCLMYKKLDTDAVDYMMDASYMEDDIRMETNKTGFCKEHFEKMYARQNRLGLALMLYTHLQKVNTDLAELTKDIDLPSKKRLLKKSGKTAMDKVYDYLKQLEDSCYICNRINRTFDRYIDTFFYMWKREKDFIEMVKESGGFCLNHFGILINVGSQKLGSDQYQEFLSILTPLQTAGLKALEQDLDWFIKKFDYRFNDEPWRNSKDALPRALTKIGSAPAE